MRLQRGPAYWLLVLGTFLWVGAIVAAPLAEARGIAAGGFIYEAFHTICHQQPERSFHLAGEPLAVCHRCTGLYLGFFVGLLAVGVFPRLSAAILARPRIILPLAVPMFIDAILFAPWNVPASRFGTGFLAAFAVSAVVWAAVGELWERHLALRET